MKADVRRAVIAVIMILACNGLAWLLAWTGGVLTETEVYAVIAALVALTVVLIVMAVRSYRASEAS